MPAHGRSTAHNTQGLTSFLLSLLWCPRLCAEYVLRARLRGHPRELLVQCLLADAGRPSMHPRGRAAIAHIACCFCEACASCAAACSDRGC